MQAYHLKCLLDQKLLKIFFILIFSQQQHVVKVMMPSLGGSQNKSSEFPPVKLDEEMEERDETGDEGDAFYSSLLL